MCVCVRVRARACVRARVRVCVHIYEHGCVIFSPPLVYLSLGLISDSFHMFFDCTALLAGLIATVIAKWSANDNFTYG